MGLYKYTPEPSGRMGLLWTLGTIGESAVLEFGSMGHMIYAEKWLSQTCITNRSRLYSTHMDEKDIALGITVRLEEAIKNILQKDKPKALFILPSSIPETIGTDLEAICEEIEGRYDDTPILCFGHGGFQDRLAQGMEEGLCRLAEKIPRKVQKASRPSFNIIGSCADLARFASDAGEIRRLLKGALDMEPVCILSSDTSVSRIEQMGAAHINLVLRREGVKAAEVLKDRFGTPYYYGRPYGYEGTLAWITGISEALQAGIDRAFIDNELRECRFPYEYCRQIFRYRSHKSILSIGGNADVAGGILDFACRELGMRANMVWCDNKEYGTDAIPYWTEAVIEQNVTPDLQGILMAEGKLLKRTGRNTNLAIGRTLNSIHLNPYEAPFVGFRGMLNLCSLWMENLQ